MVVDASTPALAWMYLRQAGSALVRVLGVVRCHLILLRAQPWPDSQNSSRTKSYPLRLFGYQIPVGGGVHAVVGRTSLGRLTRRIECELDHRFFSAVQSAKYS